jgi:hypothetical protein
MSTRLYLPSSGVPPLADLLVDSNWELTNGLTRLPCYTAKKNTALTTKTLTWISATTQQWCWWQFQSETLQAAYNWTTADTVSMVVGKCAETSSAGDTHLVYAVRVVSGNGLVVRGVIGLYHSTSTEYPLIASAATRIHSARVTGATSFSSQPGDRIIIEIGLHGVTPGLQNIQMRIGDPSAVADFALTAALTTDLCGWVQLSRTVVFGVPVLSGTLNQTTRAIVSSAFGDVSTLGSLTKETTALLLLSSGKASISCSLDAHLTGCVVDASGISIIASSVGILDYITRVASLGALGNVLPVGELGSVLAQDALLATGNASTLGSLDEAALPATLSSSSSSTEKGALDAALLPTSLLANGRTVSSGLASAILKPIVRISTASVNVSGSLLSCLDAMQVMSICRSPLCGETRVDLQPTALVASAVLLVPQTSTGAVGIILDSVSALSNGYVAVLCVAVVLLGTARASASIPGTVVAVAYPVGKPIRVQHIQKVDQWKQKHQA